MKFTHADVEADRYKPVGSLFMSIMDADSIKPRAHRAEAARALYDHSLPNTALSLYENDLARDATPVRCRRHFRRGQDHFEFGVDPPSLVSRSSGRSYSAAFRQRDQLGSNLEPRFDASPTPRQKRYIPEPRHDSPAYRHLLQCSDTSPQQGQSHQLQRPQSRIRQRYRGPTDHLSYGALLPREEPPPERKVPEPMVLKPRHTGLRMFPERRSRSVDDVHRGVRRVPQPEHWKSVQQRQAELHAIGIARQEAPPRQEYRNQSNFCLAAGDVMRAHGDRSTSSVNIKEEKQAVATALRARSSTPQPQRCHNTFSAQSTQEPQTCWRGRSSSAKPPPRSFDIITGQPIPSWVR